MMALNPRNTLNYREITEEDGIRLMLLKPRASSHGNKSLDNAEIQCSLIHTTLLHYENDLISQVTALSYV